MIWFYLLSNTMNYNINYFNIHISIVWRRKFSAHPEFYILNLSWFNQKTLPAPLVKISCTLVAHLSNRLVWYFKSDQNIPSIRIFMIQAYICSCKYENKSCHSNLIFLTQFLVSGGITMALFWTVFFCVRDSLIQSKTS